MLGPIYKGVLLIGACSALAACGGGSSSSGSPGTPTPPPPDLEIGGFYTYDATAVDGTPGAGFLAISEDGEFHAFENPNPSTTPDFSYIHGWLDVSGDSVSGTARQIAPPGFSFILDNGDMVQAVEVALQGDILAERELIDGTATVDGQSGTATFRAEANAADQAFYEIDSSLAAIAGRYFDVLTGTGLDITVDENGDITDNLLDCTITGRVVPIDSRFNLYDATIEISACADFVEGSYEAFAIMDEAAGVPLMITAGDNGADEFFVYALDEVP